MNHKLTFCLTIILLTSFILPAGSVSAQEGKGAVTVPTLQAPRLTISLTNPAYTWTKITGATSYQMQVYSGSTKIIDKYINSSYCVTACKFTPSTNLTFSTYKWHVRALVGGVWKAWTAYTWFTVSKAFISQFNGNASGWLPRGTSWQVGSEYVYTTNVPAEKWSNFYRSLTTYTNFDFSARVKMTSGSNPVGLAVRMGLLLDPQDYWNPGYVFYCKNDGTYAVFLRVPSEPVVELAPYTSTSVIVPYDWNILRVIAIGPTFHYYINGSLVASVTDPTYSDGYVGFSMYSSDPSQSFQVDWAKLTPLDASFKLTDTISPEQQALNEAAAQSGTVFPESGE